jgi:hypothetical protein
LEAAPNSHCSADKFNLTGNAGKWTNAEDGSAKKDSWSIKQVQEANMLSWVGA